MEERRNGKAYRQWLMDRVGMQRHTTLFHILYETEFTWLHPLDENRAEDGINLRYIYTQNEFDSAGLNVGRDRLGHEYRSTMEDFPCSVLEMLLALAMDIENSIMYDPPEGDRTEQWFWMMLENVGLARFDDRYFRGMPPNERQAVCNTISGVLLRFMDRKYDRNGNGGLFPIREPRSDQREEDLWYQANEYAIEQLNV